MPHVKITNPDIIDLAAWQQVINVVNTHDDQLTQLTNNFGLAYSPSGPSDNWTTPYDSGSQIIIYGRAKLDSSDSNTTQTTGIDAGFGAMTILEKTISFNQTFSSNPIVTATPIVGGAGSSGYNQRYDAVVTIESITTTEFIVRIANLPSGTYCQFNWIAIGPKA